MTYSRWIEMDIPTTTFQSKQIVYLYGTPRLVATAQAKRAKKEIEKHFAYNKPNAPIRGQITVTLCFFFPAPKSHNWNKTGKEFVDKTTKPDIDNLCKGFIDAMVATGWIENDQSICSLHATKYMHQGLRGVHCMVEAK